MASSELAIDGGKRVRIRAIANPAWTKKREQEFFAVLAASCNVAMAARAAGVRPQRAYGRSSGLDRTFQGGSWSHGIANVALVMVGGVQVVGTRQAAVQSPQGGSGADTKARTAIDQIIAALVAHGLIASA